MFKKVYQTTFFDEKKGTRGNCLRACVASLFGDDIDNVPFFEQMKPGQWQDPLEHYLKTKGYELDGCNYINNPDDPKPEIADMPTIDGYFIMNGESPRGVKTGHSVIYKDGELYHDPHPDGTGLTKVQYAYMMIPIGKSEPV